VTCCHVERGLADVLACAVGVSAGLQQRRYLVLLRCDRARTRAPGG